MCEANVPRGTMDGSYHLKVYKSVAAEMKGFNAAKKRLVIENLATARSKIKNSKCEDGRRLPLEILVKEVLVRYKQKNISTRILLKHLYIIARCGN